MIRSAHVFKLLVIGLLMVGTNAASAQGFGDKSKAAPANSEKIMDAMDSAETAHDIQRNFPGATTTERQIKRAEPLRPEKIETQTDATPGWWSRIFGEAFLRLLQFIGWGLLTLLALALIYFAATTSGVWQRRTKDDAIAEGGGMIATLDPAAARDWLREADELAQQGRYGEAVHFLLFRSFQDLVNRHRSKVRPEFTSREILREVPLRATAATALTTLVATVERSEFAGSEIYAHDFELCRAGYQNFVQDIAA
jgi:hypothetical protein